MNTQQSLREQASIGHQTRGIHSLRDAMRLVQASGVGEGRSRGRPALHFTVPDRVEPQLRVDNGIAVPGKQPDYQACEAIFHKAASGRALSHEDLGVLAANGIL